MLILNNADVCRALPMERVVEAMKQAYASLVSGKAEVPLRAHLSVKPHDGNVLVMPAFVDDENGQVLSVKVATLFPGNAERGLPLIQAAVLACEPDTGRPIAMLDGAAVTAIRTGAASGAATDLMARDDCKVAAIFGSGAQARTQLEGIAAVRQLSTVWIYGRSADRVSAMVEEMAGQGSIPSDVRAASSPQEAVIDADIICCATSSHTPVFNDSDLKTGVHINAIGSYQPHVQEVPAETVLRARVIVDDRESALSETGDLIQPIQAGLIGPDHIVADLGEVVLGKVPGRTSQDECTFFKSVGHAIQDAFAVRVALEEAAKAGLGSEVDF